MLNYALLCILWFRAYLHKWKAEEQHLWNCQEEEKRDKVAQRSLVAVEEKDSVSDSDEDTQPEFGGAAIVKKPQKYLSPQTINAHPWMVGMKRHDFEHIQQIKESGRL
jgi:hypothetical protein